MRKILTRLLFDGPWLNLDVQSNSSIDGHLDTDQNEEGLPNLENALINCFRYDRCGILTSNSVSVAIACQNFSDSMHYFPFNSHPREAKGYKASLEVQDVACALQTSINCL